METNKQVTRAGAAAAAVHRREAVLSGLLSEIGVASVLTLLEMERRSGAVHVRVGDERGLIGLRAGKVVRAAVAGQEMLTGREALFAMLGWERGRFDYVPGAIRGADEMRVPTSHLLIEAARHADERRALNGG